MVDLYDARGNLYVVALPEELRSFGLDRHATAADAVAGRGLWAAGAVASLCGFPAGMTPPPGRHHRSDGLLVGPFGRHPPFDLVIVNTDGTLAERSGNGLTIFAQSLADRGLASGAGPLLLRVHHDKPDLATPTETLATVDGAGFRIDMGVPAFGPAAVGAVASAAPAARLGSVAVSTVPRLAALDPAWSRSLFVRLGNPHCVTLLSSPALLPSMEALGDPPLRHGLVSIAFAAGSRDTGGSVGEGFPCPAGVNLQWAAPDGDGGLVARIFERGEGPTASSGSSATAVAAAAWRLGLVTAPRVPVHMPGGTAPIGRDADSGRLGLFGTARRII